MWHVCALRCSTSFFTFRDSESAPVCNADTLYWEHVLEHRGERILFRCCNTAWASRLKEIPGQLYYPVDCLRNQEGTPALAITLFHHPYNWLTPTNGRAFRERVQEVSDLILTGHEHETALRTQRGIDGEVNMYLEGGALQRILIRAKASSMRFYSIQARSGREFIGFRGRGITTAAEVQSPSGRTIR